MGSEGGELWNYLILSAIYKEFLHKGERKNTQEIWSFPACLFIYLGKDWLRSLHAGPLKTAAVQNSLLMFPRVHQS